MTMDASNFFRLADIELLNLSSLLVLTVLCAGIWIVLSIRLCQGREWFAARPLSEAPWGLVDVWIIMVIWFAGGMLASAICATRPSDKTLPNLLSGIVTLAATSAGIGLLWFRYRTKATRLIFSRTPRRDVWIGAVTFVAVVPPIFWLMSFLTRFFPYTHDTLEQIKDSPTAFVLLSSYFAAALAAPIGEEFFFRFVLQSWFQRLRFPDFPAHRFATIYGDFTHDDAADSANGGGQPPDALALKPLPIVASALLFAAMHLGQGPAPIALFVLGLALGYLFYKTGSIVACIMLHACLNFYSLTWETLKAIEQSIAN